MNKIQSYCFFLLIILFTTFCACKPKVEVFKIVWYAYSYNFSDTTELFDLKPSVKYFAEIDANKWILYNKFENTASKKALSKAEWLKLSGSFIDSLKSENDSIFNFNKFENKMFYCGFDFLIDVNYSDNSHQYISYIPFHKNTPNFIIQFSNQMEEQVMNQPPFSENIESNENSINQNLNKIIKNYFPQLQLQISTPPPILHKTSQNKKAFLQNQNINT